MNIKILETPLKFRSSSSNLLDIFKFENSHSLFEKRQNLKNKSVEFERIIPKQMSESDKFQIVIEGISGKSSIAELCRREGITQDIYLSWCNEFKNKREGSLKVVVESENLQIHNRNKILQAGDASICNYLENYLDLSSKKIGIFSVEDRTDFTMNDNFSNVVDFQKINDLRFVNKHFEKINAKMPVGGLYIGCFESIAARMDKDLYKNIPILKNVSLAFQFVFKRVIPKLPVFKKLYFNLTLGKNRLISKSEGLGRLVCCGFSIMDYKSINGMIYFIVNKKTEPAFDMNPSYGPLYKMPRLGKNGQMIGVFKLRTMHPYSEYLQDYILKANGYGDNGKPADDFRVPDWAKFMRKFWLDEIPQLLNVLKGEMKLVGIRPVSKRYFQDIPKEMQKLRMTQKPGCIPPYVALNRKGNVISVLQAEKEYLEEKIRNPYTTDTKYFFKAIYNIIVNNKRSA